MQAPIKTQAYRAARVGKHGRADIYACNICEKEIMRSEAQVDHKIPVTPLVGWDDWNGFIDRMFCPIEDLQVVCRECHKVKTLHENQLRRLNGAGPHGKRSNDRRAKSHRKRVSGGKPTLRATHIETGREIKFSSAGAAARMLKLDEDNIKKCLKNTRKRVAKWRFECLK